MLGSSFKLHVLYFINFENKSVQMIFLKPEWIKMLIPKTNQKFEKLFQHKNCLFLIVYLLFITPFLKF